MNAKMKGPEGHSGFSYQGTSYEPDAEGFVEIPQEAVGEALCHGFTIAAEQPKSQGNGAGGDDSPTKLAKMTKPQLVALAKKDYELDLDPALSQKAMVEAIEAAQAAKTAAA